MLGTLAPNHHGSGSVGSVVAGGYGVVRVFVTVTVVVRVVERGASPDCAAPAVIVIVVVGVVVFVIESPGCDAAAKAIIAFASDVAGSAGIEPDSDMV